MLGFGGGSSYFDGFFVVFILFFLVILGVFVFAAVRGISQWNKNNKSPRLTVNARIVSKRIDVTHHHHNHGGGGIHTTSSTWYYVTFEVESGDRIEFSVSGSEYGILAEGDFGRLTFQGTRYLGFVR